MEEQTTKMSYPGEQENKSKRELIVSSCDKCAGEEKKKKKNEKEKKREKKREKEKRKRKAVAIQRLTGL